MAFYGSPAGQAFVNKQPILTKGTIEINQKRVLNCLPQINQIVAEQQATENGKTINLSSDQVKRLSAVYDVFGKASDEFLSQWIEFIGTHSNAEFSIRVNELMVAVFHDVTKDRPVTELDKDDAYSVMLSAFDPSPPTNVSPKAYGWIKRKSLSDVEAQRIWDAFTNGLRRTEVEFNIQERKAATTE